MTNVTKERMMKDQLRGQLQSTYEFFERSTRSLTEEDSDFAPSEGVFTVAGQVAHVAQTIEWFVDGAFRPEGFPMDFEAMDAKVRNVRSLSEARAWLERAVETTKKAIDAHSEEEWHEPLPDGPVFGGMPRAMIFGGIVDHSAHHRGALTVYARLRGKVPPMPYMEG